MEPALCLTFPDLSALSGFTHAFTLRHPAIDVKVDREEALQRLGAWHRDVVRELGFSPALLATVKQVHGSDVRCVDSIDCGELGQADGLVCDLPGRILGIYVADCAAVYLADPVRGAFGLLHSGKKGSEQNITGRAIALMQERFGSQAEDIVVQLSPCI